jgi:hypothetical protein
MECQKLLWRFWKASNYYKGRSKRDVLAVLGVKKKKPQIHTKICIETILLSINGLNVYTSLLSVETCVIVCVRVAVYCTLIMFYKQGLQTFSVKERTVNMVAYVAQLFTSAIVVGKQPELTCKQMGVMVFQ